MFQVYFTFYTIGPQLGQGPFIPAVFSYSQLSLGFSLVLSHALSLKMWSPEVMQQM